MCGVRVLDEDLGCFTDPSFELHAEGECCFIQGGQQRAIGMADDEFYPGTCESDKICVDDLAAEAEPGPARGVARLAASGGLGRPEEDQVRVYA